MEKIAPKRFNTKADAIDWVKDVKGDIATYFTTTFVSDHYAPAYGLKKGGWYVTSITSGTYDNFQG